MHEDIEKRLKIAAGSVPDNGSFDEVWLRATQIQRRRAGIFSAVAASLSLVVVMSAGALTSSADLRDQGVNMPAGSPDTANPTTATVTVPDVTGLPLALAQEILRDAGLDPTVVSDVALGPDRRGEIECGSVPWSRSDDRPRKDKVVITCRSSGSVKEQDPPPGTVVPVGTEIRIEGPVFDVFIEEQQELRKLRKELSAKLRELRQRGQ